MCLCGSRILVDASIYDSFKSKFTEAVERITVGDPSGEQTDMGSVISHDHRDKVESYIRLAVEEGGNVLTGGTSADAPVEGVSQAGAFLRPTVIEGLSHTSRTATEEIFGPVVTLHAFHTEDEACLLYTSPSPRDATLSRMPSSA